MKRTSPVAWELVGCGALLFLIVVPTCLAGITAGQYDLRVFLLPVVFGYIALANFLVVAGIFSRSWRAKRRARRQANNARAPTE
jgi:hypothetical protein